MARFVKLKVHIGSDKHFISDDNFTEIVINVDCIESMIPEKPNLTRLEVKTLTCYIKNSLDEVCRMIYDRGFYV